MGSDPTIQALYDTQSYNRYTYVKNNPLKYTDPSGYSWLKKVFHAIGKVFKAIKKYIKVIVVIVVTVVIAIYAPYLLGFTQTIGLSASLTLGQTMIVGAIAGFASGAIKGAIFGAISAGVAKGIGDYYGHEDSFFNGGKNAFAKALAHGISRAAISKAQGGRWSSGFWSGFITSGFSVGSKGFGGFGGRTAIMALVGGTVSRISGGKFALGAVSSAFQHMFNDENFGEKLLKNTKDLFEGIFLSMPRTAYAYGDYLGRLTGFRDWQEGNIIPSNRWQAELEYKAFEYAIENEPLKVASALVTDMKSRPNYYIGSSLPGIFFGPTIGLTSATIRVSGSSAEIVHQKANEFIEGK